MKYLVFLFVALTALSVALGETLASGSGRFEFHRAGKTVPVWYFLPEAAKPETPVLFVMHGVKRNADQYRDDWMPQRKNMASRSSRRSFPARSFP